MDLAPTKYTQCLGMKGSFQAAGVGNGAEVEGRDGKTGSRRGVPLKTSGNPTIQNSKGGRHGYGSEEKHGRGC